MKALPIVLLLTSCTLLEPRTVSTPKGIRTTNPAIEAGEAMQAAGEAASATPWGWILTAAGVVVAKLGAVLALNTKRKTEHGLNALAIDAIRGKGNELEKRILILETQKKTS